MTRRSFAFVGTSLAVAALACASCASRATSDALGTTAPQTAGPVAGPPDAHCTLPDGGTRAQPVVDASCHPDPQTVRQYAGFVPIADAPAMYGSEGDDDACKYHVQWSATPIGVGQDVTFTIVATYLATDAWLCAAAPRIEAFLGDAHPAPVRPQVPTEVTDGTYTVGPVAFDAPGRWTIRIHFSESCADVTPDSPHGHAAFYVDVP